MDSAEEIESVLRKAEIFIARYSQYKCSILYDCDNDAKFLRDELQAKKLCVNHSFFLTYINLRNVFPLELTGGIKNISLDHALEVLNL